MTQQRGIVEPPVVLVHGLWMGAWAMRPLAARLRKQGRHVHIFAYPTRTVGVDDNADTLAAFVAGLAKDRVDFVAHSLGGLVTLHALQRLPMHQGRVVLLGSPINGSATADRFANWPGAQILLGTAIDSLSTRVPGPDPQWSVSMIAGNRRVGLGVLVSSDTVAGDGTVALEETRAQWLREHLVLPESHSSLLISSKVANQVLALLG